MHSCTTYVVCLLYLITVIYSNLACVCVCRLLLLSFQAFEQTYNLDANLAVLKL